MTSFIYMHGLGGQLVAAEEPDVVVERISEADSEGEDFVTLTSHGSVSQNKPLARTADGKVLVAQERHDSFSPLRIRHAMILAVRGDHPGEVPDPAPGPDV